MSQAHTFIQSFNRSNLEYEVRKKEKKKSADNIMAYIKVDCARLCSTVDG
jgi:superfamily II DNA helicase RecQ